MKKLLLCLLVVPICAMASTNVYTMCVKNETPRAQVIHIANDGTDYAGTITERFDGVTLQPGDEYCGIINKTFSSVGNFDFIVAGQSIRVKDASIVNGYNQVITTWQKYDFTYVVRQ